MSEDESHYRTYPQGYSKREVNQLKRQAFLLNRKRLDPTQEIDESLDEAHQSGSSDSRVRRNSDQCGGGGGDGSADEDGSGQSASATSAETIGGSSRPSSSGKSKRSSVRQFFNFRPRAKSENAKSMSKTTTTTTTTTSTASQAKHRLSSGSQSPSLSDNDERPASPQLATIKQGEEYVHGKLRSRSPKGLVSRLKQLTTDDRRRKLSPGKPPVQGLPHPSDIPLDAEFLAQRRSFEVTAQERRKTRMRKTVSADSSVLGEDAQSITISNVQERHRDLFENLSHSADLEGQCSIQSATAMAESQGRSRRFSGPQTRSRPLSGNQDVQVTENEKYIIFRSKCQHESTTVAMEAVREASASDPDRVFVIFAQQHRCYDLIPTSSKLLVFDHNLNVKKAFFALVYNGLRAAPVWDSEQQKFVGMLTITDFIHILHSFYRSSLVPMEELESHKISTWRSKLQKGLKPFLWISPEASLFDAVKLLLHARVHRLPVVEPKTGNALFILTHKRILKYIYLHIHQLPLPSWFDKSLRELKVGTYAGVLTVTESTPLVQVLNSFVQNRVSAMPVLDSNGRLTDIYSKFDVINLAATKSYNNLDISVKEALQYRQDRFEGVTTCQATDSLRSVVEKLVTAEVHRLVVVDSEKRVTGVVSLSDILQTMVLDKDNQPAAASAAAADGNFVMDEPMETS